MIKRLIVPVLSAAVASAAQAADKADLVPGDFTGNVALVSDYMFRGISQTLDEPAIQGGFDWSMKAGPVTPYVGTWASNVDFGIDETLELDGYGGVKGEFAGIGWDLGLIYYAYPGAGPDYDYLEIKAALSYAPHESVTLGAGYFFSPDFFAETGAAHYLNASVAVAPGLPLGLTLTAAVGHQWVEDNVRFGTPDYTDWSIGIAATVDLLTVSLTYTDTDLDESECFAGTGLCNGRVVAKVAAAF